MLELDYVSSSSNDALKDFRNRPEINFSEDLP